MSIGDAESRITVCGSHKVHYATLGEGPTTMVFVHGWACNLNFWREQAPAFSARARLVFIDLPGHGQSDKPDTAYTMDFLARAVVAVLRDARIEKAVFVGHSMGAAVLCRLYQQVPEKFAALVSVDGLLCRPPGTPEQARLFIGQFCVPEWQALGRRYFAGTFFHRTGSQAFRDAVIAEMFTTPQHVIVSEAKSIASPEQPDWALTNVEAPVVVLNARNSPWWGGLYESYVKTLSTRVDYRLFDGVGHFLMLEKPAEFNAGLREMLRKFGLLH